MHSKEITDEWTIHEGGALKASKRIIGKTGLIEGAGLGGIDGTKELIDKTTDIIDGGAGFHGGTHFGEQLVAKLRAKLWFSRNQKLPEKQAFRGFFYENFS